jgi:hypothetical protein
VREFIKSIAESGVMDKKQHHYVKASPVYFFCLCTPRAAGTFSSSSRELNQLRGVHLHSPRYEYTNAQSEAFIRLRLAFLITNCARPSPQQASHKSAGNQTRARLAASGAVQEEKKSGGVFASPLKSRARIWLFRQLTQNLFLA